MAREPRWNQRVFYEFLLRLTQERKWLDLGCGRGVKGPELQRVRALFREAAYAGVDLDMDSLRDNPARHKIRANGDHLPFPDRCFDVVSSNMVFEHLGDPLATLREINRVLRDEGVAVIHTASSHHLALIAGRILSKLLPRKTYVRLVAWYTGRAPEDIFPAVYRANTARSFAKAAGRAGLHPIFVSYLPTPYSSPKPLQWIERSVSPVLPGCLRGTLLALCVRLTPDSAGRR